MFMQNGVRNLVRSGVALIKFCEKSILIVLVLVLFAHTAVFAQRIAFDVKTSFGEKGQLKTAKAGCIAFLKESSWAAVKEMGEDYSLWITNYSRELKGDNIEFKIMLELRTKAMFGRGKIVQSFAVQDDINVTDIRQGKISAEHEKMISVVQTQMAKAGDIKSLFMNLAEKGSNVFAPGAGSAGRAVLTSFGAEADSKITNTDALEGLFVGAKVAQELRQYFQR
jgi:hypothetical protein